MRGDPAKEGHFLNLTEKQLDEHIYRIMPEKYVFKMFEDYENTLSKPCNWKDKFENFQLGLGGLIKGVPFEYRYKNDFVGQCWTRHGLSEAMWGIYANNPKRRFLRIRSTPRKLLEALVEQHQQMPNYTCFVGRVRYLSTAKIKAIAQRGGELAPDNTDFAEKMLIKRYAFKHENEVRLLYFGDSNRYDSNGLYRYEVNPHEMITQIMADPNRKSANWEKDKKKILRKTKFSGEIKRSKIYDPPNWSPPNYTI